MSRLSEIDEFGLERTIAEPFDHKVSWLNVSMNDAYFVKGLDTLKYLFQNGENLKNIEFSSSSQIFLKILLIEIHINSIGN